MIAEVIAVDDPGRCRDKFASKTEATRDRRSQASAGNAMKLTPLQIVYLVLSVFGVIGTWYFNLQIPDLASFFVDSWATPLTSSLSMDLLVVVLAFFAFMVVERRRLSMSPLAVGVLMVLTFAVAVAFTLPMFLFLRERAAQARSGQP